MITIDGSLGEGGGQILRTSLTLAMLTQQSIEIVNIRAGRKKPGLLRQHLTCVLAAQAICQAEVQGAELGSQHVVFRPQAVRAGEYRFAISGAGSTALVCQTVFPALAVAEGESMVTFIGGTHNGLSPSVDFLQKSYFPIWHEMGVVTAMTMQKIGFNPAGGGEWQLRITPAQTLKAFNYTERKAFDYTEQKAFELTGKKECDLGALQLKTGPTLWQDKVQINVLISGIEHKVAQREVAEAIRYCRLDAHTINNNVVIKGVNSACAGNSFQMSYLLDHNHAVFEMVGEVRVSAEKVARRAAGRFNKWVNSGAAVEEYLADQLLIPMWMAGEGRFSTTQPSLHCQTNMQVIKAITGCEFYVTPIGVDKQQWLVRIKGEKGEASSHKPKSDT